MQNGGIFLFEQYDSIIEKYPIKVRNCYKGRGAIILDTESGKKLLKEVQLHDERLSFLNELLSYLSENNFYVDSLLRTKEGELFVEEDSKKYILKNFTEGREVLFHDKTEVSLAVSQLALMHQVNRKFKPAMDTASFEKSDLLLETLMRHTRELVRIRNGIKRMGSWSEFDLLFLEKYEMFYKQAISSMSQIEAILPKVIQEYERDPVIIHGQYNHHNIIIDDCDRLHIQNFEFAAYNLPIIDLYGMLRKTLEKNDWDVQFGLNIIDVYGHQFNLQKCELEIMVNLFSYPEKFWKISNYYFNQNKAWKPKQTWVKLKRMVVQEDRRQNFIENLKNWI